MEYYIEDFTEENYRRLLQIAKANNKICNFDDALNISSGIILRHDIDFSVHRAAALSKIEKSENIQSTFFIHLHSQFYHVMEKEITNLLKQMIADGCILGLHFEPGYYDLKIGDVELLNEKALAEKKMLEEICNVEIRHMSFHNPAVGGDWYKIDELYIGGMLNVYAKHFRENYEYCSDSNGYWRFKRLEEVLRNSKGRKIQILTHPVWWQKVPMWPYERVKRSIMCRAENNLSMYSDLLESIGRENVKGNEKQ